MIIILFVLIWLFIAFFSFEAEHHKLPGKIVLTTTLATYLTAVLYLTVLNRKMGTAIDYELELFWSYKTMVNLPWAHDPKGKWLFREIVLNIVLFVPFGFLPALLHQKSASIKRIGLLAFLFSLLIELSQLFFRIGLFELDDLFDNTVGAVIGYGIFVALVSLASDKKNRISGFVWGLLPFLLVSVFFLAIYFMKSF